MKKIISALDCNGVGISHIARDCDMADAVSFYKNQYQMYYIFEGERYFYLNETCYLMKKGTLTFVDKKQIPFTNVIGGKSHDRFLAEFEENWLKAAGKLYGVDFLRFFKVHHGVFELYDTEQIFLEDGIKKIEILSQEKKDSVNAFIKNELLSILIHALRGMGRAVLPEKTSHGKMDRYVRVREIINYIMLHYTEVNGLDDVAQIFYIDKSYLSRIFKEVANFTVNEFINFQRIEHAKDILIEHDYSIEKVSKILGFTRISYFDQVFKRQTGMTPLQYRRIMKIEKTGV